MTDLVEHHGWTAIPRDPAIMLKGKDLQEPRPQTVQSINRPDTALATAITDYAKAELPEQTFNHSMRVYYYGNPHARRSFLFRL